MTEKTFDVIVVGAGPAGSTFVSAMADSGLSIAIVDKAWFPRDKACGDAIPGRAIRVLEELDGEDLTILAPLHSKQLIKGGRAIAPNGRYFDMLFQKPGYTIPRRQFDYALLNHARKNEKARFFQGDEVKTLRKEANYIEVLLKGGGALKGKMVIGCDGSNSLVGRKLGNISLDRAHHSAAVRAYYENIQGVNEDMMEIYFLKDFLPGYFWIFPLGNNRFNAGFGMLSEDVVKKNIHLRDSFRKIIRRVPEINKKFAQATRISPVSGAGLAMGSRSINYSGAHYLLCGDAASLIDPATGEGIGNAMLSAQLAAQTVKKAFEKQDFSAKFLKVYDKEIQKALQAELKNKARVQKLLKNRPGWINFFIGQASENGLIKKLIEKVF